VISMPQRAFELAKRAMALDDSLGAAHTLMSHVCLWKNQHAQAISELERAIDLDPNDANGYADLAETLRTNPQLSLEVLRQRVPFKDTAALERIGDALRKAGLK